MKHCPKCRKKPQDKTREQLGQHRGFHILHVTSVKWCAQNGQHTVTTLKAVAVPLHACTAVWLNTSTRGNPGLGVTIWPLTHE